MKYNDILFDKYLDTLEVTISRLQSKGARDKWPLPKLHIWDCDIYTSPYLLRKAFNLLKETEIKGMSSAMVANTYKYPTYFARIPFLFVFRPLSGLTNEEILWLGYKIMDILNIFYKGNFDSSLERHNFILDDNMLDKTIKKIEFNSLKNSFNPTKKLLSQIHGKLYMYLELLFNDMPNVGYEIHGPYTLNNKVILIREYYDLKFDFWGFSEDFPFKRIIIYELYDKNDIRIGIDIHGRLYTDRNPVEAMRKYAMYVNDTNFSSFKNMEEVSGLLDKYLQKGAEFKSKLNKKLIIKSFAYTRSKLLYPLIKLLGSDFNPPKEILDKIDKYYLSQNERSFLRFLLSNQLNTAQRFDTRKTLIWKS